MTFFASHHPCDAALGYRTRCYQRIVIVYELLRNALELEFLLKKNGTHVRITKKSDTDKWLFLKRERFT